MSRDREKPSSSRSHRDRDRDYESSKKDKKKKSKDKRHRHRHRDGDDGGSDDAATREKKLPRGVKAISDDDYFLKATEFRVWLKQHKNKYVEELSTDETMRLFQHKFVKRWNSGRLDQMFYDGIPESVLETTKRTRHAWGFVKNLNDKEKMDLATAKDSVGVATRKSDLLAHQVPGPPTSKYGTAMVGATGIPESLQEKGGNLDRKRARGGTREEEEAQENDYGSRHKATKRRHYNEAMLEELAPRETGREALLEKRRQVGDKLHGAARDRDANRDGLDLSEDFLMGGGGREKQIFQQRLAQRADARQRRDDGMRERVAAAQAKETARMDKFLTDMGISATAGPNARPITIQRRRDP